MIRFAIKGLVPTAYIQTVGDYVTGRTSMKSSNKIEDAKLFNSYKAAENKILAITDSGYTRLVTGGPWVWQTGIKTEYEILEIEFQPVVINRTTRPVNLGTSIEQTNVGSLEIGRTY